MNRYFAQRSWLALWATTYMSMLLTWAYVYDLAWATQTASENKTSRPTTQAISNKSEEPYAVGFRYCKQAEWEKALEFFIKLKQTDLFRLSQHQRAMLFLYLGLSRIHLLQDTQGIGDFEKALLLDPCVDLPSQLDISPQIQKRFAQIKLPYTEACRRQRLAELQERLATLQPLVKVEPNVNISPPKRESAQKFDKFAKNNKLVRHTHRGVNLSAWLVLGTGVVTMGAAIVLGGIALTEELKRNEQPYTTQGTLEYLRLDRQLRERIVLANILFVTAGSLIFTGFALHISQLLQPPIPPSSRPIATISIWPQAPRQPSAMFDSELF
jgi:hypothetical protein